MELKDYRKNKEYLICVDSDGCAMDTMDIKHFECFGPCMVTEWGLEEWREPILKRWNEINLYSMTRGINRFKGLVIALGEIDQEYKRIEELDVLTGWAEHTKELSNGSLQNEIQKAERPSILQKALSWSKAVNESITLIPDEKKKPFEGVGEALAYAKQFADIAIVSSANLQAVLEEWEMYGLLEHTDIVLAQDAGSKAYCIGELLKKGYEKHHVIMTGDAPGDLQAAQANEVFYYPILVKKEAYSWANYREAVDRLLNGSYEGAYQERQIQEFTDNLTGGKL